MNSKLATSRMLLIPVGLFLLSVASTTGVGNTENQTIPSGRVLDWSEFSSYIHDFNRDDFMELLLTYSNSHRRINEKGKKVCWIDENLNPFTGDWIARTLLKARGQLPVERGKDYNHSAFCDFIISDLVGIRPEMGIRLTIQPLIPENYWDWFCLDRVKYHGKMLTILWDKEGSKYNLGKGFSVYVDGRLMHRSDEIEEIEIPL
jgi:hypothetical protein